MHKFKSGYYEKSVGTRSNTHKSVDTPLFLTNVQTYNND